MAGDANKKMEETRTKLTNEIMAIEEDMTAASDSLRKVRTTWVPSLFRCLRKPTNLCSVPGRSAASSADY